MHGIAYIHDDWIGMQLCCLVIGWVYIDNLSTIQDYHEYETVDEAFGLAEHGTTTNENNKTRPPQESYFDESGSSVITQSNPAYVSNIEDVSTQDNVSYQKSSPYVTVIA